MYFNIYIIGNSQIINRFVKLSLEDILRVLISLQHFCKVLSVN